MVRSGSGGRRGRREQIVVETRRTTEDNDEERWRYLLGGKVVEILFEEGASGYIRSIVLELAEGKRIRIIPRIGREARETLQEQVDLMVTDLV